MLARIDSDGSRCIEAYRARVLLHAALAQLFQVQMPWQDCFVGNMAAVIESLKVVVAASCRRWVSERFRSEVKAALLERHKRSGRKETRPAQYMEYTQRLKRTPQQIPFSAKLLTSHSRKSCPAVRPPAHSS